MGSREGLTHLDRVSRIKEAEQRRGRRECGKEAKQQPQTPTSFSMKHLLDVSRERSHPACPIDCPDTPSVFS